MRELVCGRTAKGDAYLEDGAICNDGQWRRAVCVHGRHSARASAQAHARGRVEGVSLICPGSSENTFNCSFPSSHHAELSFWLNGSGWVTTSLRLVLLCGFGDAGNRAGPFVQLLAFLAHTPSNAPQPHTQHCVHCRSDNIDYYYCSRRSKLKPRAWCMPPRRAPPEIIVHRQRRRFPLHASFTRPPPRAGRCA